MGGVKKDTDVTSEIHLPRTPMKTVMVVTEERSPTTCRRTSEFTPCKIQLGKVWTGERTPEELQFSVVHGYDLRFLEKKKLNINLY